eukprot:scaffold7352_cov104-Skeletonema_dohrnii-CCMP3373.AAC.2
MKGWTRESTGEYLELYPPGACFVLVIPVIEEGVQEFDTEAEVRRGDTSEIWGVQFEVLYHTPLYDAASTYPPGE